MTEIDAPMNTPKSVIYPRNDIESEPVPENETFPLNEMVPKVTTRLPDRPCIYVKQKELFKFSEDEKNSSQDKPLLQSIPAFQANYSANSSSINTSAGQAPDLINNSADTSISQTNVAKVNINSSNIKANSSKIQTNVAPDLELGKSQLIENIPTSDKEQT